MKTLRTRTVRVVAASALFIGLTGFAMVLTDFKPFKKIPLGSEKELKVTIEGGLADIFVSRGTASSILDAERATDESGTGRGDIRYSARDGVGYVSIDLSPEGKDSEGKKKHKSWNLESTSWNLRYTDAIPISFDIELGLGEGDIDMSGLNVKDFDLSTGASSVRLAFNEPNRNVIENMTIEAGLSKFRAMGLGNANFKHLRFEGGVGRYSLDFSGALKNEVDVDAEVGLGTLTITIPSNIGARILYEKNWICEFDVDPDFVRQSDTEYQTDNYASARGKINLRVEAGFGSVRIRRD
jgi:hypothetical protein